MFTPPLYAPAVIEAVSSLTASDAETDPPYVNWVNTNFVAQIQVSIEPNDLGMYEYSLLPPGSTGQVFTTGVIRDSYLYLVQVRYLYNGAYGPPALVYIPEPI